MEPDRAKKLKADLARWRETSGAWMPKPNPDDDPARAEEPGKSPHTKPDPKILTE
jgi:hypothetical protein